MSMRVALQEITIAGHGEPSSRAERPVPAGESAGGGSVSTTLGKMPAAEDDSVAQLIDELGVIGCLLGLGCHRPSRDFEMDLS
jgi:hypothetical protein